MVCKVNRIQVEARYNADNGRQVAGPYYKRINFFKTIKARNFCWYRYVVDIYSIVF